MSFSNGELSAADIAAVTGNNNGGFGFGNGDGGFWLLILFLFAMMGGWNNNGNNNCGNMASAAAIPAVQAGFDQAAVMGGLNGLTTSMSNGFANAELSRANTQANLTGQLNGLAMSLQNCCCENRSATADLKFTMAQEASATRANTDAKVQNVMDKLCQMEMDGLKAQLSAKDDLIAQLRDNANLSALQASQVGQTGELKQDFTNQLNALAQRINPSPIPAYMVQNPNGCNCGTGFGCGCAA